LFIHIVTSFPFDLLVIKYGMNGQKIADIFGFKVRFYRAIGKIQLIFLASHTTERIVRYTAVQLNLQVNKKRQPL